MLTILIQGPLRNNLYKEYLEQYKKYGEIILVVYKNDNTEDIEKLYPWTNIIKIEYPDLSNCFNFNNTFLQTNGILEGLKHVNTEYVIRVRSDESYPNMDKFIDNIKKYSEKIHVCNLYSLKDNEWKFHLGNHIFASKTKIMKKAFLWAYDACNFKLNDLFTMNGDLYIKDINGKLIKCWSEILQTISFIKALDIDLDSEKSKEIIINNFYMTPLRNFPDFKWSHKINNYEPITKNTKMEYDPSWESSFTEPNRFMLNIEDI